ncbi:DNA-binding protein [Lachnospiraceae bacterium WCA-693-APC-MOT-I]|uniref:UPF0122 protein FYJ58_10730 n=1 Tax=Velocimicrobium porci TaxID=2606634 RepID=A0A6L5Y2K3_9FIRM|nr:DNA-binding protein [Velocimicrobium porci]
MNEIVELSLLFDFYGALLKEQKRQIFEDYVLNDLSLSEIASDRGISRQAVHDTVKRCRKELEEYEEKLSLIKKFQSVKQDVHEIQSIAASIKEHDEIDKIQRIVQLSNRILDEL